MKLVNDTRTKLVTPLESQKLETRTQDKEAEIFGEKKSKYASGCKTKQMKRDREK